MTGKLVEFHQEAATEYEAAVEWYAQHSRLAARKFVFEVDRALNFISEAPNRWPKHTHGTRRFLLQHFPFAIVYRESSPAVHVIAIAHGRRRPGYWKERF